MTAPAHFKGKKPLEHLLEARMRGKSATEEVHGAELPGHLFSAFDAAKETAMILLILSLLLWGLFPLAELSLILALFAFSYLLWKCGRSTLLGWIRLERLHRLIEEERWEIEHHRTQERKELMAMYQAKGFSGRLLEEVVDVLMAEDNRLLQVMLQEELGLSLETFEHPLKQGAGALIGSLLASVIMGFGFFLHHFYGTWIAAILIVSLGAALSAKKEKNKVVNAVIRNAALAFLIGLIAITLKEFLFLYLRVY